MFFLRITQGPFDPEVIQSEHSIEDPDIKVTHFNIIYSFFIFEFRNLQENHTLKCE